MRERQSYVVDASVAVKWHLHDEDFSVTSQLVLADYREGRTTLLAPDQLRYEVPAAIRTAVSRRRLAPNEGATAIDQFLAWNVPTVRTNELIRAGYLGALDLGCALYDGLYLALAEAARCQFVYADERLRNTLAGRFPLALWIEEYQS